MKSIFFFVFWSDLGVTPFLNKQRVQKCENIFDLVDRFICLRAKIVTILYHNKFAILNNKIKTNKF